MRRFLAAGISAAILAFAAVPASAQSSRASSVHAGECLRHVESAERAYRIPRGMLRAIGYVEASHANTVWPWTLNISGQPHFLDDRAAAAAKMKGRDGQVHRDMDVGCMQINVRYHAAKFPRPEAMLDPRTNVMYAAWYLRSLYDTYGTWTEAVARYHSSKQEYQIRYLCRVVNARIALGYQLPTRWYVGTCNEQRQAALR